MKYNRYLLFYSAWKQWNIAYKQFNVTNKDASSTEDVTEYVTDEDATDPETVAYLKRNQGTYTSFQESVSYSYHLVGCVYSVIITRHHTAE